MHISDCLLQLLHANPLTQEELCAQLGKEWDEFRETVGFLTMYKWAIRERGGQERYSLTPQGRAEYDRRVTLGTRLYAMKKRMTDVEEKKNVQR